MLREHDPLAVVRAYGEERRGIDWESSQPRRTRPNRVVLRHEENIDTDSVEAFDPVEEWQLQTEDECIDVLNRDAREKNLASSLDATREAELLADRAQAEGDFESLYCEHLDPVPTKINDIFSAVLGDIFHAIDRVKIPVHHYFKKAYKASFMRAMLEWDPNHLKEVKSILLQGGWTEEEFESMLYYKPSFFRERVKRVALPPRQMYYRVRAVFVSFGYRKDSRTQQPLFNERAWRKADNILKEILKGWYSDPPDWNFYYYKLDKSGGREKDKNGIPLIRSRRGTSLVENVHRQYNTQFRHVCGIELGDCLLAERRHRHNIDVAKRVFSDYPCFGHYDTWDIDLLQSLIEKNSGRLLYSGWRNVSDYIKTEESSVTVPRKCHS